jgi:MoaA/NifB/PqqE/SkfB family radical SAM enzyme
MPLCYSPWSNIDISPTGAIAPCCKFQTAEYPIKFNLQNSSITDYTNSEFLKKIKQEFVDGQWPTGCIRCRIEEENNIESKRILDYTRWQNSYDSYDLKKSELLTASIAFGNTCNLTCITCNSASSSRWHKEYKDIYNIDIPHFKFYKENFVKNFIALAPNIIHVDIPGGEPLLSGIPEQQELLAHYIATDQAKNITLHYTTNVTIFPDPTWWALWQHFKEVDIQLSIDGIGTRYEYIRYPGNWATVVDHTAQYIQKEQANTNIRISVSHTVSAYNIFYLDEFFSWCYNIGLPRPWLGRVHNPAHMRPTVWAEPARTKIINQLLTSKNTDILNWATLMANNDDSSLFDKFKIKIKEHDDYRQLDFRKTFPELAEYI